MIDEPLVVGLGERRYEVQRPWGLGPADIGPGRPTDVAVDSEDNLFVYTRYDRYVMPADYPQLIVFTPDGKRSRSFELPSISDGHGIAIGPRDEIVLADRDRHEIRILNKDGTTRMTLGRRNGPGEPFSHPTAAGIGPDGDIFVTDGYGNSHVHRFSAKGELLRTWGRPGSRPGEFSTPHDIDFGPGGEVIVCDRENNRLQIFDVDGVFIREIGDVFHPMDVHVDRDGMILVSDQIPRLSMFNIEGKLLGRCRPVLNGGHGMASDSAGNIYLSENRVDRVTRLRRVA